MKKRFSAFLLAALMVASLLPAMSFAAAENKTAATAAELKQAIEAATGETVITLTADILSGDSIGATVRAGAEITIKGEDHKIKTGLVIGNADGDVDPRLGGQGRTDATVTVENVNFETVGLAIVDLDTAVVNGCTFTNITECMGTNWKYRKNESDPWTLVADALLLANLNHATATGNTVDGTDKYGAGIDFNDVFGTIEATGNTVKNTHHNSIQAIGAASTTITGNTMENWGLGDDDGRAFRGQPAVTGTVAFNANNMVYTANGGIPPEQYAKVDNTTPEKINLDNNYWNGLTELTSDHVSGTASIPADIAEELIVPAPAPAPVYGGPVMNWVKCSAAENGVVKSGPLAASEGATITLYPKAATGYVLDTVEVLDAAGNAVAVEGLKFKVPAGGVTVNATFKLAE